MVFTVDRRLSSDGLREEDTIVKEIKQISTVRSSFETCRSLRRQNVGGVVALDIKGTNLGTEQGEIMMISLADRLGQIYIFDVYRNPLLVSEGGLQMFLTSRQVCKVVHGADVVCSTFFWRIGCYIENVFDTQICHRILVASPSAVGSESDHDSDWDTEDEELTSKQSPLPKTKSGSVPINSWQSDHAIRHHVTKPTRKNPIGLIIKNKSKRAETPEVTPNRISLIDVSYDYNYSDCTSEDSVMKLCRTYGVACEPLNALVEYRLRQLQQYWRARPITAQMTGAITRDIAPLIDLYDQMTQVMDGDAVAFVIDTSSNISRRRVAPLPKSHLHSKDRPPTAQKIGSQLVTANKTESLMPAAKNTTSQLSSVTKATSLIPGSYRPVSGPRTSFPNGQPGGLSRPNRDVTESAPPTVRTPTIGATRPGTSVNFQPTDVMTRG